MITIHLSKNSGDFLKDILFHAEPMSRRKRAFLLKFSRTQERVVLAKSLETVSSLGLPGLNTQLLGGVELLGVGPGEVPAPDPVHLEHRRVPRE